MKQAWKAEYERIWTERGDYVLTLPKGVRPLPDAAREIRAGVARGADVLYADETLESGRGERLLVKPAYSPDTLRSYNYIGFPLAVKESLLARTAPPTDGTPDEWYAFVLRLTARAKFVLHLPRALTTGAEQPLSENPEVLRAFFREQRIGASVARGTFPGSFCVRYGVKSRVLLSTVILNAGAPDILRKTLEATEICDGLRIERIVVDGRPPDARTRRYYDALEQNRAAKIVRLAEQNPATLRNAGALAAHGDALLFLDAGVVPQSPDAIDRLLEHALLEDVGAVGGKQLLPDNTLLHGAEVVGVRPEAVSLFAGTRDGGRDPRFLRFLDATRNVSAVNGGAMLVPAGQFAAAGGFDASFAERGWDTAFCVRLTRMRRRVIFVPGARFFRLQPEKKQPVPKDNLVRLQDMFRGMQIDGDPMLSCNPALVKGYRGRFWEGITPQKDAAADPRTSPR